MSLNRLTPRQRQLAELIAEGLTNAEIAAHMGITEQTVKNSISDIYLELDIPGIPGGASRVRVARMVWEAEVGALVTELLEREQVAA